MAIRRPFQQGTGEQDPEVGAGPFASRQGPGTTTTPEAGEGPFVDRTQPAQRDPAAQDLFGGGEGQSQESPRERQMGPTSTMRKPQSPTPMAGSSFSPGDMMGPIPFSPLGGISGGAMARPGSLFGSRGGLQGGGLGLPLDPSSDAQSDPISTLIQLLMRGK